MLRVARWMDDQLGLANLARRDFLRKVFPDHWSFMFGEIALYSFLILVLSGTYLSFFFRAGSESAVYEGAYAPLRGIEMSQAYASTLTISFDVQAGLLVRQLHHWAALVFVAAISVHMARVFFTGAFRRPRQLNWIVGVSLLGLALFSGFTGYSIVDDLLSGTGLAIAYSVFLSIPFLGPGLALLFFGGPVPSPGIIPRLYAIHIMILPVLIAALLAIHLAVVWRQKHTNYPGEGRGERTIVGIRMWPVYATKSTAFFFLVFGILVALGALVEINPIWLYGPYDPSAVTAGSQPDWYIGWLEGALRLFPAVEPRILGVLIPSAFIPGALLGIVMLGGLYLYPFIEERVTGDRAIHHVLDRPPEHPARTAIGAGAITFFLVLLLAGSNDVLAVLLGISIDLLRDILRALVVVLPVLVLGLTYLLLRRRARNSRGAGPG